MERRSSFHPSEDSFDLQLNQEDDYSMPLSALSAMPTPAHGADTAQGRRMDNVVQMQGSLFTEQVKKDSQKVCIQRSIFLAVLVTVGVLGTVFIHESTAQREQSLFETYFESLADQLTDNFLTIFEVKILTSISVSVSLTSDAQYYNKTWPNSLLPDFDLRLKGDRIITGSHTILFSPLVTDETRASWEAFVLENANQLTVQPDDASSCTTAVDSSSSSSACRTLADGIYMPGPNGTLIPDPGPGPYFPGFLLSTNNAPENAQFILTNYYAVPGLQDVYNSLMEEMTPIMSDMKGTAPRSLLSTPVFNQITPPQSVVGAVQLDVDWLTQFQTVSPSEGSIVAVLVTGGGDVMSFEIFDGYVVFLGDGDLHDPQYDNYVVTTKVSAVAIQNMTSGIWQSNNGSNTWDTFGYSLSVYPTSSFEAAFKTNLPAIYTAVSAVIFAFIILMFALYDVLVHRRQQHVMGEAVRFRNVVNSLFPAVVRNRLFAQQEGTSSATTTSTGTTMPKDRTTTTQQTRRIAMRRWDSIARRASNDDLRVAEPATTRLRTFLHRSASQNRVDMEQYRLDDPIADLFPETTIMFADISGFTAWSSEREPSQVFYLLETLYHAFDELASRLGVFKVETIGDCYVAVTGLPDPNQDHALVMARFAYECLLKMNELVKSLEVSLGPGTSDLAIRVGLHSGPVTAGVLRGEKARFQLFGDTMNTASRMESTGTRNRIHVSEDTAMLLRRGGKEHWLTEREGLVNAKGKGEMKTWWLRPQRAPTSKTGRNGHGGLNDNNHNAPETKPPGSLDSPRKALTAADTWGNTTIDSYGVDADKKARLVNWNVEIFGELLSKVVVWRSIRAQQQVRRRMDNSTHSAEFTEDDTVTCAFDEVSEVISFPTYSEASIRFGTLVPDASRISDRVKGQLHHFISRIADCYRNVPFHNLEHASHVTLSANKLMKRIIAPGETDFVQPDEEKRRLRRRKSVGEVQNSLESMERISHISTFGISSDPLCQLAIVFSALIHDVDHYGVTNAQLVKENAPIAAKYHNRSVAEQNSVDIAWGILMDDQYQDLRCCIFETETERRRFRQLVVNSVMATDIVDKELKQLRDKRWATAFDESKCSSMSDVDMNRKATIVIEHIIQASDVAHTMQHWHIYSKWNEKLFCEMYTAYLAGRAATDPSEGWYGGEIWFFDNYIIPLAKKLKECGVFGVASDEYLGFALENREEWVIKGKTVVANMLKNYKERHGENNTPPPSVITSISPANELLMAEKIEPKKMDIPLLPKDEVPDNIPPLV